MSVEAALGRLAKCPGPAVARFACRVPASGQLGLSRHNRHQLVTRVDII